MVSVKRGNNKRLEGWKGTVLSMRMGTRRSSHFNAEKQQRQSEALKSQLLLLHALLCAYDLSPVSRINTKTSKTLPLAFKLFNPENVKAT